MTGDESLEVEVGLELLVETARLWMSLGHHDVDGAWHIVGVTGPDEYTAIVKDNLFTNLAAAHNLHSAAEAADRHPELARGLGVTVAELAAWRRGGRRGHRPLRQPPARAPAVRGVHPAAGVGLRGVPRQVSAAAARARTSTCTAAR